VDLHSIPPTAPTVHDLFATLFNGDGGVVDVRALRGDRVVQEFYAAGDHAGIANFVDLFEDWNLYFGVASRKDATGGGTDNLLTLGALYCDIDFARTPEPDATARLDAFPLQPSAVINSGNGWHCYWLLREPFAFPGEADQAGALLRRLAATLDADPGATDLARVLRVPGTLNMKYSPRRPVVGRTFEPARRYNPGELEDWLLADPAPPALDGRKGPFQLPLNPPVPGQRYKSLFAYGRHLKVCGMLEPQVHAALQAYNATFSPPKSEDEVADAVRKVFKARDRKDFAVPVVEPTRATEPEAEAGPDGAADATTVAAPEDLAVLLDDTAAALQRFIVMTLEQAQAAALWAASTHVTDAFDLASYLHVTAGTKGAGKSVLMVLLSHVVARSWYSCSVTKAALVRRLDKDRSTLLLDETDQQFADKELASALIGVLNAGYSRFLTATICTGQGADIKVQEFSPFGPKCFAGIGALPSTIADRSIVIRLRKKRQSDTVERARDRIVRGTFVALRKRWERWHAGAVDLLRDARPVLPEALDDRAQDNWEGLLAIADLAGAGWPERARRAAVQLSLGRGQDDDPALMLLADIRELLKPATGAATVEALDGLVLAGRLLPALEKLDHRPWATWSRGEVMTPHALSKQLEKFEVRPVQGWSAELKKKVRGYPEQALIDAFSRYLAVEAVGAVGTQ
jgi:Protein of unknown function (DUF3631)/RepB DNA-primase from phage plasmid